ncbi:MAG: hypothetical protein ACFFGP_03745, partial [Promethearchaeota archaeon]
VAFQTCSEAVKHTVANTGKNIAVQTIKQITWKTVLYDVAKRFVVGTIGEVLEEIILDGLIETFMEGLARVCGFTESVGLWFSIFGTSARETHMFTNLAGPNINVNTMVELQTWINNELSIQPEGFYCSADAYYEVFHEDLQDKMVELGLIQDQKKSLQKTFLKGFGYTLLAMTSIFMPSMAGLNMYAFKPLGSMLGGYADAKIMARTQVGKHLNKREKADLEAIRDYVDQINKEDRTRRRFPSKPMEIVVAGDEEFSGRVQERTTPHVYDSQQERTTVEVAAQVSNDLLSREISGSIQMRNSWDYSIDSNNYVDQAIDELQEKLAEKEQLEGRISNLLNAFKGKWSSTELARLEESLSKYKEKIYCGYQVLVDAGPYGGVNYEILNILSEKRRNGEVFTAEESEIYSLGALLMSGPSNQVFHIGLFDYSPLYDIDLWVEGTESPYCWHFDRLINSMVDMLFKERIITENSLSALQAEFSVRTEALSDSLERFAKGKIFNIAVDTLELCRLQVIELIKSHNKEQIIPVIEEIFENYCIISGWSGVSKFYRPLKTLLYKLSLILYSSGEFSSYSQPSIERIEDNYIKVKDMLKWARKSPDYSPSILKINNLMNTFLSAVTVNTKTLFGTEIEAAFEEYMDLIRIHNRAVDILKSFKSSIRKQFLQIIINSGEPLQQIPTVRLLCDFLFSRANPDYIYGTFLSESKHNKPPFISDIWSILFSASQWTVKKFTDIGIEIDDTTLFFLKQKVFSIVNNHIINSPYKSSFLSHNLRPKFLTYHRFETHYKLAQIFWLSEALHEDVPDLPLKDILGIRLNHKLSSDVTKFTDRNLLKALPRLRSYLLEEGIIISTFADVEAHLKKTTSLSSKARVYLEALSVAKKYIKQQEIKKVLKSSPAIVNTPISTLFNEEFTKAYNVIMGLGRFLGFDPMFFTPLDDAIFEYGVMTSGTPKYVRHEPFGLTGTCIDAFLQVLTDNSKHNQWRTINSAQAKEIINAFEALIKIKGNIDKNTIDKLFRSKKWLYNNVVKSIWYNNPKFNIFLQEFNKRKQEIRSISLIEFLSQDGKNNTPMRYPKAVERFHYNALKSFPNQIYGLIDRYHLHGSSASINEFLLKINALISSFDTLYTDILKGHGIPFKL